MGFLSAIRVALAALLIHKGRSVLTSLGIVIGIGAVIAMVSAGDGARMKLDEQLENVGKTFLSSAPARTRPRAPSPTSPPSATMTPASCASASAIASSAWPNCS